MYYISLCICALYVYTGNVCVLYLYTLVGVYRLYMYTSFIYVFSSPVRNLVGRNILCSIRCKIQCRTNNARTKMFKNVEQMT